MMTAYLAALPSVRPVSTGSRTRAATVRLAHVMQERRKIFGYQPSELPDDTVAALG
jgi:hypothetical protein